MFDNICKILAEAFPEDVAAWLVGDSPVPPQILKTELSQEPIRADSVLLLELNRLILHAEFQTQADAEIPLRMTDYRLRLYRKYPSYVVEQVVVYLRPTNSPLVYQNTFTVGKLHHEFRVVRLWEQPTELFLARPGLLPFAVLSRTDTPERVLRQVAQAIEVIPERRLQSNISACSFLLAGLVLGKELTRQILREDIMKESVTYQFLVEEAQEERFQKTLQALSLLKTGKTPEQVAQDVGLTVEQVQTIQRAL